MYFSGPLSVFRPKFLPLENIALTPPLSSSFKLTTTHKVLIEYPAITIALSPLSLHSLIFRLSVKGICESQSFFVIVIHCSGVGLYSLLPSAERGTYA